MLSRREQKEEEEKGERERERAPGKNLPRARFALVFLPSAAISEEAREDPFLGEEGDIERKVAESHLNRASDSKFRVM